MKVAVIMGSKSDLTSVLPALEILKSFGVETETRVLSAHRTPDTASSYARGARAAGIEVIIAAAGKAAHLAGVVAGHTTLPVIGLPIKSSTLDGLDSLLSTVQMPGGVPVATVAIDGGKNAGLLAVQILSLKYEELVEKLEAYKKKMEEDVLKADSDLQWEELLEWKN
jgi:5-(carboxyamino)imidazole ribonucleotide mutase